MTESTISIERIIALGAVIEAAHETMNRVIRDARAGEISPGEAAEIINQTVDAINIAAH